MPFSDFERQAVEDAHWRRVVVGAWKRPEPIHLLEACRTLMGLRREVCQGVSDSIVVSLGDNLAEVSAFEAGRAFDLALNRLCRQAAALALVSHVAWRRCYIPPARNPSDHDSRLADLGHCGRASSSGASRRRWALSRRFPSPPCGMPTGALGAQRRRCQVLWGGP